MVRKHKSVCTVQHHPGERLEKHYHHHLPQEENPLPVKKSVLTTLKGRNGCLVFRKLLKVLSLLLFINKKNKS